MYEKKSAYTTIFCDDDIVVLSKRSGLLVAADRYDIDAPRLDKEAEKEFGRLFAVHRIDKDTSGLVVYARNAEAHRNVCEQFEHRSVKKTYHCLVHGRPSWETLHIDTPLLVDGDARHRTIVNRRSGKSAVTDFYFIGACDRIRGLKRVQKRAERTKSALIFQTMDIQSSATRFIVETREGFI